MSETTDHVQLMDDTYRYQRLIYDVTRKYYLLGRDHLIRHMDVAEGQTVLEVACGTGRNLQKIGQRYPKARLYGLDISEQMLISARAKLGDRAQLDQADACAFDPNVLFEVAHFDHVVLSYSLSMIPDWTGALAEARRHLAPGGTLHIVDFGDCAGLPNWFERGLNAWLARFHVTPRLDLPQRVIDMGGDAQVHAAQPLFRNYAFYARITAH